MDPGMFYFLQFLLISHGIMHGLKVTCAIPVECVHISYNDTNILQGITKTAY